MKRILLILTVVAIAVVIILCRETGDDIARGFDLVDGEPTFV